MIFNQYYDNIIMQFMLEYPNHPDPFEALSEIFSGRFISKQIRNRWNNKLNPRVDHSDLTSDEKRYIDDWVKNNPRGDNNKIRWKICKEAMEKDLKKVRSREKIKNYYNSSKRSVAHKRLALTQAGTSTQTSFNNESTRITAVNSAIPIEPYFKPNLEYDKKYLTRFDWRTILNSEVTRITAVNSAIPIEPYFKPNLEYDKKCLTKFDCLI